jgi:neutral ceramidase
MSTYRAGFAKGDLTCFERGTGMFGWCQPYNVALEVAVPLEVRAGVVEDAARRRFLLAVCDLGFISTALRREVERRCLARGLIDTPSALMLAATHTHSGPTGYAEHLLYALSAPGYFPLLVQALAERVVDALARAHDALEPARLRVGVEPVPLDEPVAFNRRIEAYNRNPEVVPLPPERAAEAVDRRMTVLWAEHAHTGRPLGLVSWLGLHGTTLHADHQALHPDHKGLAATQVEQVLGGGFVALFAQGAAGDVTPNHRPSPRGFEVGKYDDDHHSAHFVARVQAEQALAIMQSHAREAPLAPELSTTWARRDFHAAPVEPRDAGGAVGCTTEPPRLGLAFAAGTREGPGPLAVVPRLGPRLAELAARAGWCAPGLAELAWGGEARLLGLFRSGGALGRLVPGPHAAFVRARLAAGRDAWVPHELPGQCVRLGRLTVVGLPMEPTTVAARRLERVLQRSSDEPVVIAGYCNDYASYLTTPEEYALQDYEGASTLFGPHTLGAWCTLVRRLDAAATGPRATP